MRIPKSLSVHSIPGLAATFFQSEFTHPGGVGRLTTRKGGTTALWRSLAGKKRFPVSALIETETVQDYLRRLEAEQDDAYPRSAAVRAAEAGRSSGRLSLTRLSVRMPPALVMYQNIYRC